MERNDWLMEKDDLFNYGKVIHINRYEYAKNVCYGNVLDLGCGTGYGTKILSRGSNIAGVVGLDIALEVIADAKKRYFSDNINFVRGDAEEIPFEENTFDCVVCFENIEHVENYQRAVTSIRKVLKPGGTLVISTPNNRDLLIRMKKLFGILSEYPKKYQQNDYHIKEFHHEEFCHLMTANSFQIEHEYGQVLRVPGINTRKSAFVFNIFNKIAHNQPKYSLIMVFKAVLHPG